MRERILFNKGYIESSSVQEDGTKTAYFVAKLLNDFGIVVDKPELLTEEVIKFISESLGENIPKGFYKNPQDLKYFSADELAVEQFVSYLQVELNGTFCLDEKVFERVEVFKKVLPDYAQGDEVKLRKFKIISAEEADKILFEITSNLCAYTRPWSVGEFSEFDYLYFNGYYNNQLLLCKDNAIEMFLEFKDVKFASMLDKKDIVKMSLSKFGEKTELDLSDEDKILFNKALSVAKDCPMSLKQAKFYNRILKNVNSKLPLANNEESIYKKAVKLIKEGKIIEAAKVFASSGSLLQRNLVFLLSRASLGEFEEILNLVKAANPIVLIQLVSGILNTDYDARRVFTFTNNKRVKSHIETDKEFLYRKSRLSIGMKQHLINIFNEKIKSYYQAKKHLGKIYVNDALKKVALPLNTSAMGIGLDVLPTGSRLPIKFDYIRTFCYWHKVFDIDASVVFVQNDGTLDRYYWGNIAEKRFGESCLCSGDDRGKSGAEYCDFKISELKNKGYKYAIYTLNGYGGELNKGEIYCGLQNKENLKTKAFSPKNIEFKIHVKGDSRAYVGFAIDFNTNEIVLINQILASNEAVVNPRVFFGMKQYLNNNFLKNFNIYKILSYMGEIASSKKEADIIFDFSKEQEIEDKEVITPFDIEKLVTLLK